MNPALETVIISSVMGLIGILISSYTLNRSPKNQSGAELDRVQAGSILIKDLQADNERKESEYNNLLAVLQKERLEHERILEVERKRRADMERTHNALFRWGDENERRLKRASLEYVSYKAPNGSEPKISDLKKGE